MLAISIQFAFVAFLLFTLVLLGFVVWSGLRGKRPLHFTLVGCAVASLGTTIYFAEKMGPLYDLEAAGAIYPIHLFIAKVGTAAYLLPVITGILLLRRPHLPHLRRLHRRVAFAVLALTVAVAASGILMVSLAPAVKGG